MNQLGYVLRPAAKHLTESGRPFEISIEKSILVPTYDLGATYRSVRHRSLRKLKQVHTVRPKVFAGNNFIHKITILPQAFFNIGRRKKLKLTSTKLKPKTQPQGGTFLF